MRANQGSQVLEHRVAGVVAEAVVDLLEVVHIDDDQTQRLAPVELGRLGDDAIEEMAGREGGLRGGFALAAGMGWGPGVMAFPLPLFPPNNHRFLPTVQGKAPPPPP